MLPGIYFPASRELPLQITSGISTLIYLRTNPPRGAPNVQLVGLQFALLSATFAPREAYAVWPAVVKPTSRGRVRLFGTDPGAPLLIDPVYLETVADRIALRRGLE